mmetsp:Transcript_66275/g.115633  ORF Transcript_66275/g.115633 Transcript_66275/m.115633 type:complete len:302 (-) Transcript_66275:2-907(-)
MSKSMLLPSPHRECAEILSLDRRTMWASTTKKGNFSAAAATDELTSLRFSTLPVPTSICSAAASAPPGLEARAHTKEPPSVRAAAQNRASPEPAGVDHSCFPAVVRTSTSDSRTTTTFCLFPCPARKRSSTPSEYSRCQVRSPVLPFHACTKPLSVTLNNPRLPALSSLMLPCRVARRRHCTVPSFSNMDATTPASEATKILSAASAEYASALGWPTCCTIHSYCPTSSSKSALATGTSAARRARARRMCRLASIASCGRRREVCSARALCPTNFAARARARASVRRSGGRVAARKPRSLP